MKELCINPEWTFKEVVDNLQTLKLQYEDVLASFYYFDLKEVMKFKKKTRDAFYLLKFEEWKRDKIWEYINGYEYYEELVKFI